MFKFVALALVATALVHGAPSAPKVEARLSSTLATKGTANVLISFKDKTSNVLGQFKTAKFASRADRLNTVAHTLQAHAEKSQKSAISLLNKKNLAHEVFWITNQIYLRNADAEIVNQLAELEQVSGISEEFEVKLDPMIQGTPTERKNGVLAEWGVERIDAPAAWNLPGGNNGQGAIVGSIDTGGHATHVDLAANFVGTNYGWRDVTLFGTQTPRDDNGHGTHTIGTMVGLNGIGVAPGAKWMACKALNGQGSGTNAGLISCGQFMACPTLPNGNEPDCTKAPHVVNNSWGGGQANPFYNEVINAWHAAGIIPVFANGNSGPACQTANSPADSLAGVIGVGATSDTNALASFSSKGPTVGGRAKPDISAPGQNVRSAWHTPGTSAYNTISGTSMAAPHVAGVVALLAAQNPNLSYDQVVAALNQNTNRSVVPTGMNCGGVSETNFPNMAFGFGIVNARNALASVISGKH